MAITLPYAEFAAEIRSRVAHIFDSLPRASILSALVLLFAAQLLLVQRMDGTIDPPAYIVASQPVLTASYSDFLHGLHSRQRLIFDSLFVICAALESLALFGLYRAISASAPNRRRKVELGLSAIVMSALALSARAQISSDVYGYIASAHYGLSAYSPGTAYLFSGNFAFLSDVVRASWNILPPCPYGPLWLAFTHAAIAPAQTVWQALLIERGIGLGAVLACTWAISRITRSAAIAAMFLLNPMILMNFVVEAHNDILGLMCILLAAVSFRRPVVGMFWQMCAGLIKLPYLFLGALAYSRKQSLALRLAASAAACTFAAALSSIFGGWDYLHALTFHVSENGRQHSSVVAGAHAVLIVLCIVALCLAVFRRRFLPELIPAFLAPAATLYPWYLAMALPYAVIGEAAPITTLASLPMASLFIDVLLGTKVVKCVLIIIALLAAYIATAGKPRAERSSHTVPVVAEEFESLQSRLVR